MTSLVPGCLFNRTGLNKKHTPTPATITGDELDKRYAREEFNGRPWPPSSPVAGVYDIRNTSTKLILINNRKKRDNQLRGKSDPRKEEHRYPEPERHSRSSTPVNRDNHSRCLDSSSPYYEPEADLDMDWLNRSQRPQNTFASGSAVNPRRHTSCQVPSDPRAFDIRLHPPRSRPNSRTSLPVNFGRGPIMGVKDLTPGEQRYFSSITRVYSCNQMIRLKRRQYIDILNQELAKGLYTKKEYERYRDYIALGRQRQYMQIPSRSMSAPLRRSYQNDTDRTISSMSGDDKSSVVEDRNTNSPDRRQSSPEKRQQTKHSGSPDKRPTSVKSNASRRTVSSGRTSPGKSSRSTSARSTSSAKVSDKNKVKNGENSEDSKNEESSEQDKKETSSEIQTNSEKDQENQTETSKTSKKETDGFDSDTNLPTDRQYSAREGHDRPKSRLGHIPEDTNENKEDKKQNEDESERKSQDNKSDSTKSQDSLSVSTISIDNEKIGTNENATQQKKGDDDDNKQKTSQSRDEDSSSDEEKDPDKLQY